MTGPQKIVIERIREGDDVFFFALFTYILAFKKYKPLNFCVHMNLMNPQCLTVFSIS